MAADEILVRPVMLLGNGVGEFFKPLVLDVEGGDDAPGDGLQGFGLVFGPAVVLAHPEVELDLLQPLARGHQESLDVRHLHLEFL